MYMYMYIVNARVMVRNDIDLPAQTLYCANAQQYYLSKSTRRWFIENIYLSKG